MKRSRLLPKKRWNKTAKLCSFKLRYGLSLTFFFYFNSVAANIITTGRMTHRSLYLPGQYHYWFSFILVFTSFIVYNERFDKEKLDTIVKKLYKKLRFYL